MVNEEEFTQNTQLEQSPQKNEMLVDGFRQLLLRNLSYYDQYAQKVEKCFTVNFDVQ